MFWMRKSQLVLFENLCQHQWAEHNQSSSCYHSDLKQTYNLTLWANWGAITLVLCDCKATFFLSLFFYDQEFIRAHDFTYRLWLYPLAGFFVVMLNLFHNPLIKMRIQAKFREKFCDVSPPPFLTYIFKINLQDYKCVNVWRSAIEVSKFQATSHLMCDFLFRASECGYY